MNQFRFAQVYWMHALWGVLLLTILLVVLELRGTRILERMLSPLMQRRLVQRPSRWRRLSAVLLLGGAWCALILALMRPQWGTTVQVQTRVDSQVMICLDVSRSMLAEDVVPNRLERAKAEIDALLSFMREGQQVGLMAFAGKATVLCPLTTDFGFLRLVLSETTPATVGVGGTRIGEAILKATDGFRDAGDVNRILLLITDGEDHDSFPLDAAKRAREKGVRIVSIGFGDELGSKIEVTDPLSGARTFIEDRQGQPVISRLDGETLREIALETQGAYIPAGTGALDLQSIYDAHIAGMLTSKAASSELSVVRNEGYQWCVLAALCLLLASLAVPTLFTESSINFNLPPIKSDRVQAALWLGFVFAIAGAGHGSGGRLWAQSSTRQPALPSQTETQEAAQTDVSAMPSTVDATPPSPGTPREVYNLAATIVRSDPERAERLLNESRREAGVDGELRFRSLYNLGWVEITRAEKLIKQEPKQALKHLELSASRFREAIRVRPDSDEARFNLEIISRRILELTDALAQKASAEFAPRLDELLKRIRDHQSELQTTVAQFADGDATQEQRTTFRKLGVVQRQIIADLEVLAADARRRVDSEQASTPSSSVNSGPNDGDAEIQKAQLSAMLVHVESALQRMYKSRSFLRRLQCERAFVRWAAGLTDAKRARDQLRDPLEVLSVLIADATEQANLVQLMQVESQTEPLAPSPPRKPNWLSSEYLVDEQSATAQRAAELHQLLSAGLSQQSSPPAPSSVSSDLPPDAETQQLMERIRHALPEIAEAQSQFERAAELSRQQQWQVSLDRHSLGTRALRRAAESFFDIRRLVDATLLDQRNILIELGEEAPVADSPTLPSSNIENSQVDDLQNKNLERAERLADMLSSELEALIATDDSRGERGLSVPSPGSQSPGSAAANTSADDTSRAAERERLELAQQLLQSAEASMRSVAKQLNGRLPVPSSEVSSVDTTGITLSALEERPPSPLRMRTRTDRERPEFLRIGAIDAATAAVDDLEELQRLFFSVIEHLRETAARQTELNDTTEVVGAQVQQQTPNQIGPLQVRQSSLQRTAEAIAAALEHQAAANSSTASKTNSDSTATSPVEGQPAAPEGESEQEGESDSDAHGKQLLQAASLVRSGSQAMNAAANLLKDCLDAVGPRTPASSPAPQPGETSSATAPSDAGEPAWLQTTAEQQLALQKLNEALQLLSPPPPDNQDSNQNQQQPEQQPEGRSEEKMEAQPQNGDIEQILQAIREREANRRREKQPRNAASAGGVEKDW